MKRKFLRKINSKIASFFTIRNFFFFTLFLIFILVLTYYLDVQYSPGADFVVYLTAAKIIRDGLASHLYDFTTQIAYRNQIVPLNKLLLLPFLAPGITGLMFLPFANLPPALGYLIFYIFNLSIVLIICLLISRYILRKSYIFIVGYTLLFLPVFYAVRQGQVSIILLLLFTLIYLFHKRKNYFLSSMFCSFLVLKPQYLLFFPFLLILSEDRMKSLKYFLLFMSVLFFGSALLQGIQSLIDYPLFLSAVDSPIYGNLYWRKVSFVPLLRSLGLSNTISVLVNFVFYLGSILLFYRKFRRTKYDLYFTVGILFSLTFSVYSFQHDLSILLLPIAIWAKLLLKTKFYPIIGLPLLIMFFSATTSNLTWLSLFMLFGALALLKPKVQV